MGGSADRCGRSVSVFPYNEFIRKVSMNKSELIDAVAEKSGLTKADTDRAFKAFVEVISDSMKNGDQVAYCGCGNTDKEINSKFSILGNYNKIYKANDIYFRNNHIVLTTDLSRIKISRNYLSSLILFSNYNQRLSFKNNISPFRFIKKFNLI